MVHLPICASCAFCGHPFFSTLSDFDRMVLAPSANGVDILGDPLATRGSERTKVSLPHDWFLCHLRLLRPNGPSAHLCLLCLLWPSILFHPERFRPNGSRAVCKWRRHPGRSIGHKRLRTHKSI